MVILRTNNGIYNYNNSLGLEFKQYDEDGVIYLLDNTDEREIFRCVPTGRLDKQIALNKEQASEFAKHLYETVADDLMHDDRTVIIHLEAEWEYFKAIWFK